MENNHFSFGYNLAQKRNSLKMTREELAARAGVSLSMLAKIERDETNPTILVASKLARSLSTTVSALLGERPSENNIGDIQHYIQELREADALLEKSIELNRKLNPEFHANFHRTYVFDRDCRYLFVSAAGARLVGITPADFTGKHWRELGLPAEFMEEFEQNIRKVFSTGTPLRTEAMLPTLDDLDFYDYQLKPLYGESGATAAVMCTAWNITNAKLTEFELRHKSGEIGRLIGDQTFDINVNRLHFLAIFAHSFDAILLTTPDGKIIDVNPAACRLFGMSRDELLVRGRGVVDPTDPRLETALEDRRRNGFAMAELRFIRKDGSCFLGEMTSNLFQASNGQVYTSMIIRNITNRHDGTGQ